MVFKVDYTVKDVPAPYNMILGTPYFNDAGVVVLKPSSFQLKMELAKSQVDECNILHIYNIHIVYFYI